MIGAAVGDGQHRDLHARESETEPASVDYVLLLLVGLQIGDVFQHVRVGVRDAVAELHFIIGGLEFVIER